MKIFTLIAGIILLLLTVGTVIWSVKRTPINLRGFYGVMFGIISIAGFLGGIALIGLSFLM